MSTDSQLINKILAQGTYSSSSNTNSNQSVSERISSIFNQISAQEVALSRKRKRKRGEEMEINNLKLVLEQQRSVSRGLAIRLRAHAEEKHNQRKEFLRKLVEIHAQLTRSANDFGFNLAACYKAGYLAASERQKTQNAKQQELLRQGVPVKQVEKISLEVLNASALKGLYSNFEKQIKEHEIRAVQEVSSHRIQSLAKALENFGIHGLDAVTLQRLDLDTPTLLKHLGIDERTVGFHELHQQAKLATMFSDGGFQRDTGTIPHLGAPSSLGNSSEEHRASLMAGVGITPKTSSLYHIQPENLYHTLLGKTKEGIRHPNEKASMNLYGSAGKDNVVQGLQRTVVNLKQNNDTSRSVMTSTSRQHLNLVSIVDKSDENEPILSPMGSTHFAKGSSSKIQKQLEKMNGDQLPKTVVETQMVGGTASMSTGTASMSTGAATNFEMTKSPSADKQETSTTRTANTNAMINPKSVKNSDGNTACTNSDCCSSEQNEVGDGSTTVVSTTLSRSTEISAAPTNPTVENSLVMRSELQLLPQPISRDFKTSTSTLSVKHKTPTIVHAPSSTRTTGIQLQSIVPHLDLQEDSFRFV